LEKWPGNYGLPSSNNSHFEPIHRSSYFQENKLKTVIILTMHGAPPKDFPRRELGEFFALHMQMENSPQRMDDTQRQRYNELNNRVRSWPRSAANDPFFASSQQMARRLEIETGLETLVCFNEFCDPSLSDTVRLAAGNGAQRVVVVTPMMTGGGEHSEIEIPAEINQLKGEYPMVEMIYAWPFDSDAITQFLAGQVRRFME